MGASPLRGNAGASAPHDARSKYIGCGARPARPAGIVAFSVPHAFDLKPSQARPAATTNATQLGHIGISMPPTVRPAGDGAQAAGVQ